MHSSKMTNVLSMPAQERLEYFVRKVCDFEEVWGLFDNGWAMSETDFKKKVICFWPEKEFAEKCAVEIWGSYSPKSIPLSDFIEKWLPGMEMDNLFVGVFQTPGDKSVVLTSSELSELLNDELENYE